MAGRSIKGEASDTLAEEGKAMTRESGTAAGRDTEALHWRVVLVVAAREDEPQEPAVAAEVEALAQHVQAVQPSVCTAELAQQQPPRHRLVPQSAAEAQASPGEDRAQEPEPGWQPRQPSATAAALQQ